MKRKAPAHMLAETLGDTSWRVRQAAVERPGAAHGGEIVARLVRALRDDHRNPSVLNSALQVLALTGEDAVAPLIELLQSPDADLRGYVVLALGEQHDPRVPTGAHARAGRLRISMCAITRLRRWAKPGRSRRSTILSRDRRVGRFLPGLSGARRAGANWRPTRSGTDCALA